MPVPAELAPVVVVVAAFAVSFALNKRVTGRYDYVCERCGHRFGLSPLAAAVAPHRFGGSKYTRCPDCGRLSWVSPVPRG